MSQSEMRTARKVVDLYLPVALLVSRKWTCLLAGDFQSVEVLEVLGLTENSRDQQQSLGDHAWEAGHSYDVEELAKIVVEARMEVASLDLLEFHD